MIFPGSSLISREVLTISCQKGERVIFRHQPPGLATKIGHASWSHNEQADDSQNE